MSEPRPQDGGPGPFNVTQLRSGDPYELSDGHPILVAPTGGAGGRGAALGSEVLETDPAVESAGVEVGYALDDQTLRAPDVSVGNVPDAHGWVRGAPALAVEYAGTGQDERDLAEKIEQLLEAGTRWIWVVRLVGLRRVEVYEAGRPMRTAVTGEVLEAPGVLQNAVPVAALFDRQAAHEATFRNLLQRRGFASIEAIREEGRHEGREEGRHEGREEGRHEGRLAAERAVLIEAIEAICTALDLPVPPEHRAELAALDAAGLRARLTQLRDRRRWDA